MSSKTIHLVKQQDKHIALVHDRNGDQMMEFTRLKMLFDTYIGWRTNNDGQEPENQN